MRLAALSIIAAAPMLAVAAPAYAGNTATYAYNARVGSVCTAGSGSTTLNFNQLNDGTTGANSITAPSAVKDTTAFCNVPKTQITVQHTDLYTSGATTNTGFTDRVVISSAKVISPQNSTGVIDSTAASANGTGFSSGTSASSGTFGAFDSLTVSVVAGSPSPTTTGNAAVGASPLLIRGNYTGQIKITISAAN